MNSSNSQRKKPTRHVWGRIKNIDVGGELYVFELKKRTYDATNGSIKEPGGVKVRQKSHVFSIMVPFDALVSGGARTVKIHGQDYHFLLTEEGIQLRRKGQKKPLTISYEDLVGKPGTIPMPEPDQKPLFKMPHPELPLDVQKRIEKLTEAMVEANTAIPENPQAKILPDRAGESATPEKIQSVLLKEKENPELNFL